MLIFNRFLSFIFLSLISTQIFAQGIELGWVNTIGGTLTDHGQSVATDFDGNVYITGDFEGTVDFHPGTPVVNLTAVGLQDVFIQKFDANGEFVWAQSIGGIGGESGHYIHLDNAGNVYVTGNFQYTIDFDPSEAEFLLSSNGGFDVFIFKLDTNGQFIWAKSLGGSGFDFSTSIISDSSKNIYLTGTFGGGVDFDPGSSVSMEYSQGVSDIFVLKLDSLGDYDWAKTMGGSGPSTSKGLTIDMVSSGDLFITGNYSNTVDFDPGVGVFNMTSEGAADIFVMKLDSDGELIWVNSYGDGLNDFGISLCTDFSNNIYVTGNFFGTIDFDAGPGQYNLTADEVDVYVMKMNSNGGLIWAKSFGSPSWDFVHDISVSNTNSVYLTGEFQGVVDFDLSDSTFNVASDYVDIYLLKLSSLGEFEWVNTYGEEGRDGGQSIWFDDWGDLLITGYFEDSTDFDPSFDEEYKVSNGEEDIFIEKIKICPLDLSTVVMNFSVETAEIDAEYQWYDCGNGFTAIIGEDEQIYYPISDGQYAVEVSKDGCIGISECISFNSIGVEEITAFKQLKIFPNPSTGMVNINLGEVKELNISVYTITGQEILSFENILGPSYSFDLATTAGIYFIEIEIEGEVKFYKLVVE